MGLRSKTSRPLGPQPQPPPFRSEPSLSNELFHGGGAGDPLYDRQLDPLSREHRR